MLLWKFNLTVGRHYFKEGVRVKIKTQSAGLLEIEIKQNYAIGPALGVDLVMADAEIVVGPIGKGVLGEGVDQKGERPLSHVYVLCVIPEKF